MQIHWVESESISDSRSMARFSIAPFGVTIIGGTRGADRTVHVPHGEEYEIEFTNDHDTSVDAYLYIDKKAMGVFQLRAHTSFTVDRPAHSDQKFTAMAEKSATARNAGITPGKQENGIIEVSFHPAKKPPFSPRPVGDAYAVVAEHLLEYENAKEKLVDYEDAEEESGSVFGEHIPRCTRGGFRGRRTYTAKSFGGGGSTRQSVGASKSSGTQSVGASKSAGRQGFGVSKSAGTQGFGASTPTIAKAPEGGEAFPTEEVFRGGRTCTPQGFGGGNASPTKACRGGVCGQAGASIFTVVPPAQSSEKAIVSAVTLLGAKSSQKFRTEKLITDIDTALIRKIAIRIVTTEEPKYISLETAAAAAWPARVD